MALVTEEIGKVLKKHYAKMLEIHNHDETLTRTLVLLHLGTRKNIRLSNDLEKFRPTGEIWIYQFEDRKG